MVGHQTFSFIGLLVLLRNLPSGQNLAVWGLLLVLAFGAVLYSVLLYLSPRLSGSL